MTLISTPTGDEKDFFDLQTLRVYLTREHVNMQIQSSKLHVAKKLCLHYHHVPWIL